MNLHEAKQHILDVGRRLYQKEYVVSNDGNMSARIGDDRIVATPAGLCKGTLSLEDLCVCDMDGNKVSGSRNPSSEIGMHIFLYRERPDIGAVVHAHPPTATGFSVAGIPLSACVLPEMIISLGSVPIADYGTPGGPGISEPIRKYVKDYDAYLLQNHGATTVGPDIMNAYFKMETLEHFARILFVARQLGDVNVLNREEVEKLLQIRERLGIRGPDPACLVDSPKSARSEAQPDDGPIPTLRTRSAARSTGSPQATASPDGQEDLVAEITRRVIAELNKA